MLTVAFKQVISKSVGLVPMLGAIKVLGYWIIFIGCLIEILDCLIHRDNKKDMFKIIERYLTGYLLIVFSPSILHFLSSFIERLILWLM